MNQKIKEKNKRTVKGRIKQAFINTFVDMDTIKAGIPTYADTIVAQLKKPKTENKIKGIVKERVEKYLDKTFDEQDLSQLDQVLVRTSSPDVPTARANLEQKIATNEKHIWLISWTLIGLSILVFSDSGLRRKPLTRPMFLLLLLNLTVLLVAGVSTPMIDLEAKISEMSFSLLDHQIQFLDQVLYFQSKSIIDVFWIMITHKDLQMKFVGVLVVTFSIIFPFFKLLSSLAYYFNLRNTAQSWWVQFFIIKSGKWSMTDVLVVAIFMAFIGFNGIISSQFAKLKAVAPDVTLLTTNGTALQQGFYLFLTYALLALFLSGFLTRKNLPA